MNKFFQQNRQSGLYFVNEFNRIIYIPQGWCDEFEQVDENLSLFGWFGNPEVSNWKGRKNKEYLTTDAQAWHNVNQLEKYRQVDETEARKIDSELFELLDAINNNIAA